MTTLTNIQNEQLFQVLNDESAATYSGGEAFLFQVINFNNFRWRLDGKRDLYFEEGTDDLRRYNFNDETSSIRIRSGIWNFFKHTGRRGYLTTLSRGDYFWVENVGIPNDSISSLRNVA